MFSERIIQLSGNLALTNKGRVFERVLNATGGTEWFSVTLPEFTEVKISALPKGKSVFIEPITKQEKWDNANNITDLTNG